MSDLRFTPGLSGLVEELRRAAHFLWERGWAEANGGNLSVDVTEHVSAMPDGADWIDLPSAYPALAGRVFLVTGSGRRFRDFASDSESNACILVLDDQGRRRRMLWGGHDDPGFKPTSELPSHLKIHEHLRTTGAREKLVLHTHPTELVALSHLPEYQTEAALSRVLWGMLPEVKVLLPKGTGLAPYALPGSLKLAELTLEALHRGHRTVVWTMHGCLATGADVMEAFDLIDTLNKAARMVLMIRAAGGEPHGLSDAMLAELVQAFGLKE